MKTPMILTLLRIILIPIFVVCFYLPFAWASIVTAVIFVLAAVTDWLDGFLARRLKQTSSFGAFLDPVADKLMVVIALVLLVGSHKIHYITLPSVVIIGREITISSLREWMAEIGKSASVAVNFIGKIKTTVQFLAIIILLSHNLHNSGKLMFVGYILLYLAALLTLWSMFVYLKIAWPNFEFRQQNKSDSTGAGA